MSKLQIKAFVLQLLCFATLFILTRFLIEKYLEQNGFFVSVVSFFMATFLSPKFQAIKTDGGEKLFMRWIFIKGVKEIN